LRPDKGAPSARMAGKKHQGAGAGQAEHGRGPKALWRFLFDLPVGCVKLALLLSCCLWAYRIRLAGVHIYGYQIHGYDPTFNWHAARYLAKHGWHDFFRWFDYQSWYPLGRPVGTTIYPGMQILSVWVWEAMKRVPKATWKMPAEVMAYFPAAALPYLPGSGELSLGPMSLNNVCVMTGAWLGAVATFFTALLTAEVSESTGAGVVAAFVMAGVPAHLMRSMAGEFDNEAHAMAWFMATFYFWCRSLRTRGSWPWALLAGLAYAGAVATWGGYIFVNNLIGLHAAVLVGLGKFSSGLHRSYSIWYVVGTAGATLVPVVGWTPLKSLEQMPSMAVFVGFQLLEVCDVWRRRQRQGVSAWRFFLFRVLVFAAAAGVVASVCLVLFQMNHFSPLSSRIRAIFLKHEKTGNPLVDSVAEHQPTSVEAYDHYLGKAKGFALVGVLLCWHQRTPAKVFPVIFAIVAYTFSLKMNRLIIICGPVVSMLAGYPVGIAADWCVEQCLLLLRGRAAQVAGRPEAPRRTGGMGSIYQALEPIVWPTEFRDLVAAKNGFGARAPVLDRLLRLAVALAMARPALPFLVQQARDWAEFCNASAVSFSHPGIVFQAQLNDGTSVMVDDGLKGYQWLTKNTPEGSRVFSWWDYGYQITGIGNRTSLADGNTWNHEHIATIGRILSSHETKAWRAMRHLADYVLVHVGNEETDLGISTHFARIGSSVFPDVCGEDDPTCTKYGFTHAGPSKMMRESFVYRAVRNGKEGVHVNPKYFKLVHSTRFDIIRIFKVVNISEESKEWVSNPANRVCDAPGSWYCVGQYPPALDKLIAKRKNFAQLEDFNKKNQEKSAYTKLIEERQRQQLSDNV